MKVMKRSFICFLVAIMLSAGLTVSAYGLGAYREAAQGKFYNTTYGEGNNWNYGSNSINAYSYYYNKKVSHYSVVFQINGAAKTSLVKPAKSWSYADLNGHFFRASFGFRAINK